MPFESQTRIGFAHSASVVNNLHTRLSGIGHKHVYFCGVGIESILHEFLYHRSGALNDFTGSNLVCHRIGE